MEENLEAKEADQVEEKEEKHLDLKGETDAEKIADLEKRHIEQESYYGKEVSKRDREIEEFRTQFSDLSGKFDGVVAKMNEQSTPKSVEPELPADYDATESTVPGTSAYNYHQKMASYKDSVILNEVEAIKKEQKRIADQSQADRDAEARRNMEKQYQTQVMGMTQKAGATQAESAQIHKTFGTPDGMKNVTGAEALRMIRALNKVPTNESGETKPNVNNAPPPPGPSGGQHADSLSAADLAEARRRNISPETMAHLIRRRKSKK